MKVLEHPLCTLFQGDSEEELKALPDNSVDSVVTDPPAGIAFMEGKTSGWDAPKNWKYPVSGHGFSDGANRVASPAIGQSSRNPMCQACHKHKRGKDSCKCEEPEFDDLASRTEDRDIFIAKMAAIFKECLRVLKPGGHAAVWAIPRTAHWTGMALEEAGFEVRDTISHLKDNSAELTSFFASLSPAQREAWERAAPSDGIMLQVFGTGFPRSLNIGKALDKQAGAEREVVGPNPNHRSDSGLQDDKVYSGGFNTGAEVLTAPSTPEAKKWDGWGTALKPAVEFWFLVRKPLKEKTVVAQVLKTGTGGLNISASRVKGGQGYEDEVKKNVEAFRKLQEKTPGWKNSSEYNPDVDGAMQGRWPPNLLLSHVTRTFCQPRPDLHPATKATLWAYFGTNPEEPLEVVAESVPLGWRALFLPSRTEGCEHVGSHTVKAPVINRFDSGMKPFGGGAGHSYTSTGGGTEEQAITECTIPCPIPTLDAQGGGLGRGAYAGSPPETVEAYNSKDKSGQRSHSALFTSKLPGAVYGDKGSVSRYFPTFSCSVGTLDDQAGERKAGGNVETWNQGPATGSYSGGGIGGSPFQGYGDNGGASRFFPTFACPAGVLGGQSGDRPSTLTGRADPSHNHSNPASATPANLWDNAQGGGSQVYADSGDASRFFPNFTPDCPLGVLDTQSADKMHPRGNINPSTGGGGMFGHDTIPIDAVSYDQVGGASRFFPSFTPDPLSPPFYYTPKANSAERVLPDGSKNPHPCLHPEALVLTDHGYQAVQKIKVGDKVYAADGTFHLVEETSRHPYTSAHLYDIQVTSTGGKTLASDNHPFLIWRPNRKGKSVIGGEVIWLRADQVRVGDYSMTPVLNSARTNEPLPSRSLDFWFAFGLYLAEGCPHSSGNKETPYLCFSIHQKETFLVDRLRLAYGVAKVKVYPSKDSLGMKVVVLDQKVGAEVVRLAGRGSGTKSMHPEIYTLSKEEQKSILEGWLAGDGGKIRDYLVGRTVSPYLAVQMSLLGEAAGYKVRSYNMGRPTAKGIGSRKFKTVSPCYQLDFTTKRKGPCYTVHEGVTYRLKRVASVNTVPYQGDVCNLSVEGSHTFQTVAGMTHNTVKAHALMAWLIKLVTPPGGIVLDPFSGSGSTLVSAVKLGFKAVGVEKEETYIGVIKDRLASELGAAQEVKATKDAFDLMFDLE